MGSDRSKHFQPEFKNGFGEFTWEISVFGFLSVTNQNLDIGPVFFLMLSERRRCQSHLMKPHQHSPQCHRQHLLILQLLIGLELCPSEKVEQIKSWKQPQKSLTKKQLWNLTVFISKISVTTINWITSAISVLVTNYTGGTNTSFTTGSGKSNKWIHFNINTVKSIGNAEWLKSCFMGFKWEITLYSCNKQRFYINTGSND